MTVRQITPVQWKAFLTTFFAWVLAGTAADKWGRRGPILFSLALEHWPAHLRGIGSGLLQARYSTGFLLSSLVFQFGYPLVNADREWGWRIMV